jgi:hypothetical protein
VLNARKGSDALSNILTGVGSTNFRDPIHRRIRARLKRKKNGARRSPNWNTAFIEFSFISPSWWKGRIFHTGFSSLNGSKRYTSLGGAGKSRLPNSLLDNLISVHVYSLCKLTN